MKLDLRLIGFVKVFENISRAKVKDCFTSKEGILVFVVAQGDFGKALGKGGINVKKVSNALKKRIKIIEYNSDVTKFIKNCLLPLKNIEVVSEKGKVIIKCPSHQEKAIVIGRDRKNLNALKELVGKFFKEEIVIE